MEKEKIGCMFQEDLQHSSPSYSPPAQLWGMWPGDSCGFFGSRQPIFDKTGRLSSEKCFKWMVDRKIRPKICRQLYLYILV